MLQPPKGVLGGGEGPVLVLRGDGATPWGQSVQISIFSTCSGRGALHLQPSISIFAGRHLFLKLCKTCFFFYVYFFCTGLKRCIFIARSQQRSRKLTGQCLLPAALHACCSRASTLLPAGSSLLLIPLAPFVWRGLHNSFFFPSLHSIFPFWLSLCSTGTHPAALCRSRGGWIRSNPFPSSSTALQQGCTRSLALGRFDFKGRLGQTAVLTVLRVVLLASLHPRGVGKRNLLGRGVEEPGWSCGAGDEGFGDE